MNFQHWIKQADISAFYFINKKLASPSLDSIMLLLREAYTWIPLYLFFILFYYFNARKYFVKIVFLSVLTFVITDYVSASILKKYIGRLRPCYNPDITFVVNNLPGCGGSYSMPSSHASNHFGLATFWFLVINNLFKQKWHWLWLWALAIGFSQVYVGVHFPGDILAGLIFGTATGFSCFYLFRQWVTVQDRAAITRTKNKT